MCVHAFLYMCTYFWCVCTRVFVFSLSNCIYIYLFVYLQNIIIPHRGGSLPSLAFSVVVLLALGHPCNQAFLKVHIWSWVSDRVDRGRTHWVYLGADPSSVHQSFLSSLPVALRQQIVQVGPADMQPVTRLVSPRGREPPPNTMSRQYTCPPPSPSHSLSPSISLSHAHTHTVRCT